MTGEIRTEEFEYGVEVVETSNGVDIGDQFIPHDVLRDIIEWLDIENIRSGIMRDDKPEQYYDAHHVDWERVLKDSDGRLTLVFDQGMGSNFYARKHPHPEHVHGYDGIREGDMLQLSNYRDWYGVDEDEYDDYSYRVTSMSAMNQKPGSVQNMRLVPSDQLEVWDEYDPTDDDNLSGFTGGGER